MKIFLSHPIRNEEITVKFAEFLESTSPQIEGKRLIGSFHA